MTVGQLRDYLEDLDDDVEVRLAIQPSWPFEYSIDRIAVVDLEDDRPTNSQYRDQEDAKPNPKTVVYLSESSQLGYLRGQIRDDLGW